jgi:hypothetical protein
MQCISWAGPDGIVHDESWPSEERFRIWAATQGARITYRVYGPPDEDGESPLLAEGVVGSRG